MAKGKPKEKPRPVPRAARPRAVPATTIAQERSIAEDAIDSSGLSKASCAALKKALRPTIHVFTKRVADAALGSSHLGGLPDLPANSEWPRLGKFPMTFIAQFRLDELAAYDVDHVLPESGLLSFFLFDTSPPEEPEPQWYSGHRVLYARDLSTLRRVSAPDELSAKWIARERRGAKPTAAVAFHVKFELPASGTPDASALEGDLERVRLPPIVMGPMSHGSQLLGYDWYQGYDAPPEPRTRNLFRCESDEQAALNFGDAQDIAFRIADDDLRERRFERASLWLQAG